MIGGGVLFKKKNILAPILDEKNIQAPKLRKKQAGSSAGTKTVDIEKLSVGVARVNLFVTSNNMFGLHLRL